MPNQSAISSSRSPAKVFLASAGISALLMLFFLLFPFRTFFSLAWSLVLGVTGWALIHPKAFFAIAGFFVLMGFLTECDLNKDSPQYKRWLMASQVSSAFGGVCIALLALSFLVASTMSSATESFEAVKGAEERLGNRVAQGKEGEEVLESVVPLKLLPSSFGAGRYVDIWGAHLDGSSVILERSDTALGCRNLVRLLKDYRVEVNARPASPEACSRGWNNTISVSLPIPEKISTQGGS